MRLGETGGKGVPPEIAEVADIARHRRDRKEVSPAMNRVSPYFPGMKGDGRGVARSGDRRDRNVIARDRKSQIPPLIDPDDTDSRSGDRA